MTTANQDLYESVFAAELIAAEDALARAAKTAEKLNRPAMVSVVDFYRSVLEMIRKEGRTRKSFTF